ncbi:outer membrane protein assembly factor BamA, partial [Acidobacteria bacterium AH-259-D05]|nr:outer membrane protein assembly factor BamA [Acidobacteria bacterium AH-259-D05]
MKVLKSRVKLPTVLLLFAFSPPSVQMGISSSLLGQGSQTLPAVQESRIEEIRIVGNRRIPESTIHYYIQSREEGVYDEQLVFRDYRNLLNTNFFEDAKVKRTQGESGIIVIFEVVERPLIRAIEYEGMKSFKESDVLERFRDMRVGLSVDTPFDPANLPKARRAIKMLLDQNGRPLGRVEVETEAMTATSQKIIFKIDEGSKVRIGDIGFKGNTVFSVGELRSALKLTKERSLISLFRGQDKFIKDKLEYDLQLNLLEKYREVGYIFARAGEPEVQIVEASRGWLVGFRKTKQQYYITIPIEEGEQYRWGSFGIEGIDTFDAELVERGYNIVPGEVINYVALKESNDELKKLYSTSGYLDMTVIPDMNTDPETKTVDVTIRIDEGKQYLVNRIDFAGNTKTRDKVLRREFFLEEQQLFNGTLLDFSVLRLNQLGFFEPIEDKDYEVIKKPSEGEVDIVVTVKEKSQQSIGLSGGVSGISGSFFGINYQSNNFRGLGQRIDIQITTGTRTSNFMFTFTEPYFLDSKMSLGISVFNQRFRFDTFTAFFGLVSESDNIELFSRSTTGFTLSSSYPIWRWAKVGFSYSLQTIKISDVDDSFRDFALNQLVGFTPGGSPEQAQSGIIRSEITPSFVYNTKNQFFNATGGNQFTVQVPIAGGPLGGTFNIIRPFVEYQHFILDRFLSGGRYTVAFRAQVNHILPYGNLPSGDPMAIPFFERIFLGDELTIRGFETRSVSPWALTRSPQLDSQGNAVIDPATGLPSISESFIPVGGDTSVILTTEYRMPLVGPLQLVGFLDFGTSTVLRKNNLRIFGPTTQVDLEERTNNVWRASTGAEVQFLMPGINVPFRLIFAYNPLILDSDIVVNGIRFPLKEDKKRFFFSVGYS